VKLCWRDTYPQYELVAVGIIQGERRCHTLERIGGESGHIEDGFEHRGAICGGGPVRVYQEDHHKKNTETPQPGSFSRLHHNGSVIYSTPQFSFSCSTLNPLQGLCTPCLRFSRNNTSNPITYRLYPPTTSALVPKPASKMETTKCFALLSLASWWRAFDLKRAKCG